MRESGAAVAMSSADTAIPSSGHVAGRSGLDAGCVDSNTAGSALWSQCHGKRGAEERDRGSPSAVELWILAGRALGNVAKASTSTSAPAIRAASFGTRRRSWSATARHCVRAASASLCPGGMRHAIAHEVDAAALP
jgi:hypothetical protein